ncbi:hypothetical protein [Sphingomicrobium clamense]|uniref:Uncharacterized protein n=1 Tax=Sphingomicrobium clamense TaxID=2851013 RepID=A0ABS6V476_9SPHN|nr:hypothetical protein [Sphingomicrobium sp. B8]MBW0144361.1 hypothetical protein [Sphingomicrobium sp. B8]
MPTDDFIRIEAAAPADRLRGAIEPGTHVLITHAPIRADTTGVPITVAAAKQ